MIKWTVLEIQLNQNEMNQKRIIIEQNESVVKGLKWIGVKGIDPKLIFSEFNLITLSQVEQLNFLCTE